MEIRTLENVPPVDLLRSFNRAFADYLTPIQLTESSLRQKMIAEGVDLRYSGGAFQAGQLVGFVLHGVRGEEVYNGGTGIWPEFRGRRLTQRIYDHLLPVLRDAGFRQCWLEVITKNEPALKAYRRVGFEKVREVVCFQAGAMAARSDWPEGVEIRRNKGIDLSLLPAWWNARPTWQHDHQAMRRARDFMQWYSLEHQGEMLAYAMLNPRSGKVAQFAVHPEHRRRGWGRILFAYLAGQSAAPLSILNIDRSDQATLSFLESVGFAAYLGQYEMRWTFPSIPSS